MTFTIVFFGWIFSLCLHEFSHALVAYLGGDYTVREKGYLTFNPLRYTHPLFSLVLPLLFLVMGGRLRREGWERWLLDLMENRPRIRREAGAASPSVLLLDG